LHLEFDKSFGRDVPFAPVIRDAEPQELALPPVAPPRFFASLTFSRSLLVRNWLTEAMTRSPHGGCEHRYCSRRHTAETVTPSLQLLVEIVEHEIAKRGE